MAWFLAIFLFAAAGFSPAQAAEGGKPKVRIDTAPDPDFPTVVDVSFFIDDISEIDLNAGSYKITGQMVLEWKDPRLAYTPDAEHANKPRDLNSEEARELLRSIWAPVFEISNERGERKTGVFSINLWPDGRIRVYEKFDSTANFRGDLQLFPYGTITLDLVMTGFLQDRSELFYRVKSFEFQDAKHPDEFIHGHWTFLEMSATEKAAKRSDDKNVDYTQVHFEVKLEHESFRSGSYHIALSVFLPLLVVFLASSALLWIDPGAFAGPRLGGSLTLILTTIALKFSLAKQLPSFNYLTLTDMIFIVTILMLVFSLMSSCCYLWLNAEKSPELATRFNRVLRVVYPLLYISVVAATIFTMVNRPAIAERHVEEDPRPPAGAALNTQAQPA